MLYCEAQEMCCGQKTKNKTTSSGLPISMGVYIYIPIYIHTVYREHFLWFMSKLEGDLFTISLQNNHLCDLNLYFNFTINIWIAKSLCQYVWTVQETVRRRSGFGSDSCFLFRLWWKPRSDKLSVILCKMQHKHKCSGSVLEVWQPLGHSILK